MEIDYRIYRIKLNHSFGISRSKNDWYDIVIVYLIYDDIVGVGEVAPSTRYNESIEEVVSLLKNGIKLPEGIFDYQKTWEYIYPQLNGIKALEMGINMALWDWRGKKEGKPLYQLLGIKNPNMPLTSYTIAIGDLNTIGTKVEEAKPYSVLKVKLGTPKLDKEIIKEVRRFTDKVIRVDANEGWDLDYALEMCKWLAEYNVEFIEQPFPANKLNQTFKLRQYSPLDIYADENSIISDDIAIIRDAFDGINIKLMKCGSIEEAIDMIKVARMYDMKIMLGCMVETSLGITAASHLADLVDCADLDGNLLINNDPFIGVKVVDGKLKLPGGSGLGVELNNKYSELKL